MQSVPEGYDLLNFVGFMDRGQYSPNESYAQNDIVHSNNTAWLCLADETTGITPSEGENWTVFIAATNDSSGITTMDTYGIVGTAGQNVNNQIIIDELAEHSVDTDKRFAVSNNGLNDVSSFPTTGSTFGVCTAALTLYEGFTIPQYSRMVFINYGKSEGGALMAISPAGDTYTAFRNGGVWGNGRKITAPINNLTTSAPGEGSLDAYQGKILDDKISQITGDAFSATKAYAVGDYAIYNNALYKFTAAKAAGAWDTSKAKPVTVAEELSELNENIIGIDAIANNLTTTAADMVLDARQGKALNDSKVSTSNVVNNLTTTASGKVLDARQGKALNDKITALSASGTAGITFTSTTVFTVFGTQLVTKSGKFAHLHLCFKINEGQSVGDGGIFAQIPSGYRPSADYGNIGVRCTAGEATAFSLLKNGNVIANGNWPTGIYVIDFGYVIA